MKSRTTSAHQSKLSACYNTHLTTNSHRLLTKMSIVKTKLPKQAPSETHARAFMTCKYTQLSKHRKMMVRLQITNGWIALLEKMQA